MVEAEVKPLMMDQRGGAAARSADWIASNNADAGYVALGRQAIFHYNEESRARDVGKLPTTITVRNKHALIKSTIIALYGVSGASDIEALLSILSGKDWHSLACLVIVRVKHGHRELDGKSNNLRSTPMNQHLPAPATPPAGCWVKDTTALNTGETGPLPLTIRRAQLGEVEGRDPLCTAPTTPCWA